MRKGITPVIAVVLLLMMTVAAAGAAFFWITTIQSRIQGQVGTQASESAAGAKPFKIVSVSCSNASPAQINVTIQNGQLTIDAGQTAITVSDINGNPISTNTSTLSSNLEANSITFLQFYIRSGLTKNSRYSVKVTLPGGSEQTGSCTAK